MCGIHGFIAPSLSDDLAKITLQEMVQSTNHRGPDFSGFYSDYPVFFGHNRLSIIDLNQEANQPMLFQNWTIVFNGEIYNYKELKQELEQKGIQFTTQSDTEVILKSFIHFGDTCVKKFIGMWAFAIYNKENQTLFCSRDRFGIKPFYYLHKKNDFYFASEIKSLKKSPLFDGELNYNQVSKGLQLGWISYADETYFSSVKQLEPGTNATFKIGEPLKIEKYWQIETSPSSSLSQKESVDYFKALFDDSMKLHLRSDVPVGATLSGGIDSSSIVCSVIKNKLSEQLNTFSIYYEGENSVDERPFIYEIEKKYPQQFKTNYFSPSHKDIANDFEKIAYSADFPLSGSSPISQYYVMKLIKESGIKVVLSGQGADDYMGGYMHSYYRLFADNLRQFNLKSLSSEFRQYKRFQAISLSKSVNVLLKSGLSLFSSEEQLYNLEYKKYYPFLVNDLEAKKSFHIANSGNSKFNNFHQVLMNYSSLPTLLHYEDRNSMAHSIESRVPFLDHRIVDFLFKSPENIKIHDGYTKWILREAMKDRLPQKIKERKDKKGFVTPGEIVWLRGPLKDLLEIDYSVLPFINKKVTENLITDFKRGNNKNANLIWRVANLHYWIKTLKN